MKLRKIVQFLFLALFIFVMVKGNMVLWLGIFLVSLIGAFVFGRFYCGYICPMNTVMGLTEKISRKLNIQRRTIPKLLEKKFIPWFVLALMMITMIASKKVLHKDLPILLILLAVSLVMTIFYRQSVFHNQVCPYGALLKLTGKSPTYKTEIASIDCIGCKKCETVCTTDAITIGEDKKAHVNDALCHQCNACIEVCPTGAIKYKKSGK